MKNELTPHCPPILCLLQITHVESVTSVTIMTALKGLKSLTLTPIEWNILLNRTVGFNSKLNEWREYEKLAKKTRN